MDLSKLSDAELDALEASLSPPTNTEPANTSLDPGGENYVPEWGQKNPNAYAAVMTGLSMAPAAASLINKSGVGIPAAMALNAGANTVKRSIEGKPTDSSDIATDAIIGAVGEGAGRGVGKLIEKSKPLADWLAAKALKFSFAPNILTPAERKAALDTYWKNDLRASEDGWLKLQNILDSKRAARNSALTAADAAGTTIHPNEVLVAGELADLMRMGVQREGAYPGYTDAVVDITKAFTKPGPRTPSALNQEKMQLQAMVEDASGFGSNTKSAPSTETRKRLAAGSAEVLNKLPGVGENNAAMSELLALAPHLARSTGRIANQDVVGLKDAVILSDMFTKEAQNGVIPLLLSMAGKARTTERAAHAIKKTGDAAKSINPKVRQFTRGGLEAALLGMANDTSGR